MPQIYWPEPLMDVASSNDIYEETSFSSMFSSSEETLCRFTSISDSMESYPLSTIIPTAASKQSVFSTGFSSTWQMDWKEKPMKQWTSGNVMAWLIYVIEEQERLNFEHVKMHEFNVDGMSLCNLSEQDFIERDPKFGSILYRSLQQQRMNEESAYDRMHHHYSNLPPFDDLKNGTSEPFYNLEEPILADLTDMKPRDTYLHSDTDSEHSNECSVDKTRDDQDRSMQKKKRGRPVGNRSKRKQEKKCGRLWEFIRDLLLKPEYCPSLICWENHDEGIFRFVRSDKVAELWGTIKDNPKMTYEKLSRAMRYYYKSKVLQPVLGRRLVYKFGPTAKGWRTNNPNFRQSVN